MASMTMQAREDRDWNLFADWCTSRSVSSLPATADTIAEFLGEFPAPIEAQGRRVRAIRKEHERKGQTLVLPNVQQPSALRKGDDWASTGRALAQVPKYHHPKGSDAAVRGRRDGWLIVLVGILALSRNEARALTQEAVQLFPRITVKGVPIPKADVAQECPACAVTRWLRVAGDASFGFQQAVQKTVSPIDVDESAHDCAVGLDGLWRQANTLLPQVDRHGWVSAKPMSARSISAAMAHRQALGPVVEIKAYVIPTSGRFANATMNELADAYDDVDQQAAAALLRLRALVNDNADMLEGKPKLEP